MAAIFAASLVLLVAVAASSQEPAPPRLPHRHPLQRLRRLPLRLDTNAQPASTDANASATNGAVPAATQDTTAQPEDAPAATGQAEASSGQKPGSEPSGEITEDELKTMLVGKPLFLRNGYLYNDLSYNELGTLIGKSPHASYTLSAVQIDKIHLTKHKLELEGARYGLHFLGSLASEDPTSGIDRVKITPKKKTLKITIDREIVIKPKKAKPVKPANAKAAPKAADGQPVQSKDSIAKATATLTPQMPEVVPGANPDANSAPTPANAPATEPAKSDATARRRSARKYRRNTRCRQGCDAG